MPTSIELIRRTERISDIQSRNFELRVLLGWIDPRVIEVAGNHEAVRKVVGEMGNLFYKTFDSLQDKESRDKRLRDVKEKEKRTQMVDPTYAQFVEGREKRAQTFALLRETRDIVQDVVAETGNEDSRISFAAEEALQGRPMSVEAALKGRLEEQQIGKFMGVAHLLAAVLDIEDQLKRQSPQTNLSGYVQIPLPKSRMGEGHLSAGVVYITKEILARREAALNPQS